MEHRKFLFFGLIGVVILVISATAFSLSQNLTYYLFPTEAVAQRADFVDGKRFRLAGLVVEGSLEKNGDIYYFEVTDGGATIPVTLIKNPPALFTENVPVLIEGAWEGDRFVGDFTVIRHDENYTIPEEGGAYKDS